MQHISRLLTLKEGLYFDIENAADDKFSNLC
ncbi:hypothetical protein L905_10495 [Agrobacterium sp. TS43]|nr:hypothetical protein L904_08905 [Agrobacterium sp. LY4]KVK44354.1 hypothetical protein L903_08720 [Agrobacterium sp. JL28]KVK49081.1 hypothetical protein L901_23615 [Agrobacterium sp. D14]KVK58283.1 hypothetical protein L906_08870 [Agrobacterium sp. TS45]KVK62282.1 hypothetical protein L907_08670 [Agrobacterium sp. C13]KVK70429.1 hypothetical protein L905_10495 [Agrobacterium sp. TS43]